MKKQRSDNLKVSVWGDSWGLVYSSEVFERAELLKAESSEQLAGYVSCGDVSSAVLFFKEFGAADVGLLRRLKDINRSVKIFLVIPFFAETSFRKYYWYKLCAEGLADDYFAGPLSGVDLLAKIGFSGVEDGTESRAEKVELIGDWDEEKRILKEKIRQLEVLATTDELTGLRNRRYLFEFSKQIIEIAGELNSELTLLVFDIDNFKHYNDVYSHLAGDEILKQASKVMLRCCRGHDVVSRVGGDEFAVLFWDLEAGRNEVVTEERRSGGSGHPKEPVFIAKRFRQEIENTEFDLLGSEGKGELTISGGLASYPGDGLSIDELFSKADEALLDAKRSGKNRIYLVGRGQNDIEDIG